MVGDIDSKTYFTAVLPRLLRSRHKQAISMNSVIRFTVTGKGGGVWTLRLCPPKACVVAGQEWKAHLAIRITANQMQRMLHGSFKPAEAISRGEVEFRGDTAHLRHLGVLLQALAHTPKPRNNTAAATAATHVRPSSMGQKQATAAKSLSIPPKIRPRVLPAEATL